jgi:hypothetical protein
MKNKVPVSHRALLARLNRKLRAKDLIIRKARGAAAIAEVGEYYTLDLNANLLIEKDVNLEQIAEQHDALAPYEAMAAD